MAAAAIVSVIDPPFLPFHNDFLQTGNDFQEISTTIAKDTNALEAVEAAVAGRYPQYNNDIFHMYQIWEEHKDEIEKYSRADVLLRVREFNERYIKLRKVLTEIAFSPNESPENRELAHNALLLSTGEPVEGEEDEGDYDLYSNSDEEDEEEDIYSSSDEEDEDIYDENNYPPEDEAEQIHNNIPQQQQEEQEEDIQDNEEEDKNYAANINPDIVDLSAYSEYDDEDDEDDY